MTLSPSLQKKKKVKKSTLRNKADLLFSQAIRSPGLCFSAGMYIKCGGSLQCAHIISRGTTSLRFDPMNAIPLCMGHHRWFHQHPFEFVEFVKQAFPKQYKYVMAHKNDTVKKTEDLYREVIEKYKVLNKEVV